MKPSSPVLRAAPTRIFTAMFLATVLSACSSIGGKVDSRLVTTSDYYANGEAGVRRYIEQAAPSDADWLKSAVSLADQYVGIVEAVTDVSKGNYWSSSVSTTQGTGFVVAEGRILTAGHNLADLGPNTKYLFHLNGDTYWPTVLQGSYDFSNTLKPDIGLLALTQGEPLDGLSLGIPVLGNVVLIAGFPEGRGLSPKGGLLSREYETPPSTPLTVVARIKALAPMRLELLAGSMPRGGMSGAPLIDQEGRCVGILSGSNAAHKRDYNTAYEILATEATALWEPDQSLNWFKRPEP